MLPTGDVQLCLHVLPTLLVALVQNVLLKAAGNTQCWLLSSWPPGESDSIFHSIKLEVTVF